MPGRAGGVSVSVHLDDADAQKELDKLRGRIEKLNQTLNAKKAQRDSIAEEMERAEAAAEKARQRVDQLKAALAAAAPGDRAGIRADLADANAEYKAQVRHMDQLNRQWLKLDAEITKGEGDLTVITDQAAALAQQIAASDTIMAKLERSAAAAAERMKKGFERVGKMIKRVFVLTTILRALRGLRTYLNDVLMSTPEFAEAFAQLKGALLTLAQPLLSVLIPALTRLVQVLTQIVQAIGTVVAQLFGSSYAASQAAAKALYDQAAAYKATGSAAKKAAGQLASFDEINTLQTKDTSGGSSAAGQATFNLPEMDTTQLQRVLVIVEAVGAALAAWKIGTALGGDLKTILGVAIMILSTIELIKTYTKAWTEGLDFDNAIKLFVELGGVVLGAALAFGSLGAGIALVVGGLALAVLGFHDMIENGMNLTNVITTIAGLLAAGIGIGILTGSWIPALLAGIAGIALALVFVFGEGERFVDGMKKIFSGLWQFFKGIFAGDVDAAMKGLRDAWDGVKLAAEAVKLAVQKAWMTLLSWLKNNASPEIYDFVKRVGKFFVQLWFDAKSVISSLKTLFEGFLNDDATKVGTGIVMLGYNILKALIDILNFLIDDINSIRWDVPDWIPWIGGQTLSPNIGRVKYPAVPQLATGAVIPPNREFLAVLGDQKSGTNIEAPLETIVAAFRQAMREGSGGSRTVVLQVGEREFGRVVLDAYNQESGRVGVRLGGAR